MSLWIWPRFHYSIFKTDNILAEIPTNCDEIAILYIIPLAFG